MLKKILNVKNARLIDKKEQKEILGGRVMSDGLADPNQADYDRCRLYTTDVNGNGSWSGYVTYEQASSQWNGTVYSDGSVASGYCCASCP